MAAERQLISKKCLSITKQCLKPFVETDVIDEEEYKTMIYQLTRKDKSDDDVPARLISRKECAERLCVSVRQVDRLADNGLLTRVKLGRKCIRFNQQQIIDIIEGVIQ